ncbi:MAG: diaminopimelate epimerase [Acidimicrobiales bacterium]
MTQRQLQKWHGAGNDFLVEVAGPDAPGWWTPERAAAVCDRHRGVGADGLIVAVVGEGVAMTLYNADGGAAEMSGNGVRCLAAALRRATDATWGEVDVMTPAGTRRVSLSLDGPSGDGSVAMGAVTFAEALQGTLGVATVGNPHAVVLDDASWSTTHREELARALSERLGGANVEFVTVIDRGHLDMTVIERGVGWTLACGTGSVAAAALTHRAGLTDADVTVTNPGGDLRVSLAGGAATLAGPVRFVADVEWEAP